MSENTIPAWAQTVIAAHLAVTTAVSHGARLKSDRYFVWMEDADADFTANNVHAERAVSGSTDLFTKTEFDPWKRQLEQAFDAAGIFWRHVDTIFEEDTGFWHYVWDWEVLDG